MEKQGNNSGVAGRAGWADGLLSFIPEKAQTSMGLERQQLLLAGILQRVIKWPFTSSPGSKEGEEGSGSPFPSGACIPASARPPCLGAAC